VFWLGACKDRKGGGTPTVWVIVLNGAQGGQGPYRAKYPEGRRGTTKGVLAGAVTNPGKKSSHPRNAAGNPRAGGGAIFFFLLQREGVRADKKSCSKPCLGRKAGRAAGWTPVGFKIQGRCPGTKVRLLTTDGAREQREGGNRWRGPRLCLRLGARRRYDKEALNAPHKVDRNNTTVAGYGKRCMWGRGLCAPRGETWVVVNHWGTSGEGRHKTTARGGHWRRGAILGAI